MSELEYIGTLNLPKKALVMDPCYSDTGSGQILTIVPGEYGVYATYANDRVAQLIVSMVYPKYTWVLQDSVSVDSGQMSVIAYDKWNHDEYEKFCAVTDEYKVGVVGENDPYAVVCETGYGDGNYDVYVQYNLDGDINGILVEFIYDEVDEEDEDDEEDDNDDDGF